MSNFLFHNKFHQANHHTIATPGLPDSATDPIASQSEPFQGVFYNYLNALLNLSAIDVSYLETFLADSITTFDGLSVNTIQSIYAAITADVFTNSQQWFEMYTNINGLSAVYGLYPTVSTTVNTYSGYWNLGYDFYSSLNTLSTNYFSTYTMVNSYSANWPFIDTTLRLNLAQQNTRSKNFSGVNITSVSVDTSGVSAYWNLSAAQCAFFRLTGTTVFKNIVNSNNKKKGGEYTLVLQQDGFGNRPVTFENDYVFSPSSLGQFLNPLSPYSIIIGVSSTPLGTTQWFGTGFNANGQLGLGNNSARNVFTALTGNWSQMSCGGYHTMALSAGTTKWFSTGYNADGQLGLGDNSARNAFTALTGNWSQMACGGSHTMALSATTLQTAVTAGYTTYVVSPTALSVTVIRFTCDGSKLYGKPTFYYYERDTIWTYFAGPGLIFTPSPAEFYINDYFIPINGLTVAGVVVPAQGYSDGGGITVVEGLPS